MFLTLCSKAHEAGYEGRIITMSARQVAYALSSRMTTCPQLKIFWTVVVSDTVLVMDRLLFGQKPTKDFLHHHAMLINLLLISLRGTISMHVDISVPVHLDLFLTSAICTSARAISNATVTASVITSFGDVLE